jgi:HAD superfamily hydrolase (TIGR01458 family)
MPTDLSRVRGILFDVDGTLLEDGRLLPGAGRAVEAVRSAGLPVRFVTNTSRRPRSAVLDALRAAGLSAGPREVLTAPTAAAAWLRERGLRRLLLLVLPGTLIDFEGFVPVEGGEDEPADAVVIGDLGDAWSYDLLDAAFRHLLGGARLVAIQRNRYWRTGGSLHLDAGPFVAALEYAADREAVVAGKPSPVFFEAASRSLDLPLAELAMVGDDLEADVLGARAAGAAGILVRTGKFRPEDLERPAPGPDHVVGSVADLPGLLGL